MEIDVETNFDPSNRQVLRGLAEERHQEILESVRKNIIGVISAYWPIETGLSRQSFKAVKRGRDLISVTNRIRYSIYVNFRRILNNGANNPNFLVVQRIVRRYFGRVVRETSRGT